jgi:hypothetical protein
MNITDGPDVLVCAPDAQIFPVRLARTHQERTRFLTKTMNTHSSVHIFVPDKDEGLACLSPAAVVKALTAGATAHSFFGEGRHAIVSAIFLHRKDFLLSRGGRVCV